MTVSEEGRHDPAADLRGRLQAGVALLRRTYACKADFAHDAQLWVLDAEDVLDHVADLEPLKQAVLDSLKVEDLRAVAENTRRWPGDWQLADRLEAAADALAYQEAATRAAPDAR